MKKILVINGHPRENSLCRILLQHYAEGAKSKNAEIEVLTFEN